MTYYAKPPVLPAWAQNASTPDLVQPASTFIQAGWLSSTTPPARQYFNWILNYCANGIRYLCQNGIAAWDLQETYPQNAIVMQAGVLYQSLLAGNLNYNPSTSPGWWTPLNYVTPASLASTLYNYVTGATLNANLANYTPTTTLNAELANYVTNTSLASTLTNYPTNAALTADLASYVTSASLATSLALKANLASPALTGIPTGPTANPGTNTSQLATTAFVTAAMAAISTANLSQNGHWTDVATGFKVNWGFIPSVAGASSGGPVNFDSAFTTQCFGVVVGFNGGNLLFNVTSFGNSSFSWSTYGSAATANVMWIAWGK